MAHFLALVPHLPVGEPGFHALLVGREIHADRRRLHWSAARNQAPPQAHMVVHLLVAQHLLARVDAEIGHHHLGPGRLAVQAQARAGGLQHVELLGEVAHIEPRALARRFGQAGVFVQVLLLGALLALERGGLGFKLVEEAHARLMGLIEERASYFRRLVAAFQAMPGIIL